MTTCGEDFILNDTIPENVQMNLKLIIEKHPSGLWGSQLEDEFKKQTKRELKYLIYGYASLEHMCSSITYICKIVKHFKGDFKLFDPNGHVPANLDVLTKNDLKFIPGVVGLNEILPRQQLVATNNLIPIKLSDFYDVSKFWFYTCASEAKFIDVMHRMKQFYTSTGKYYHIPTYKMKNQTYCVALYLSIFHRAVIVDILPDLMHSVKVFFIDYGTVDVVNVKNIYFLHESFKEPNAIAMRGQLAFVKPIGMNMPWSEEMQIAFNTAIQNKTLQAQVETKHKEDNGLVYVLKLYDNAPGKKYWLHEHFINSGLAIHDNKEQDESQSIPEFINNKQKMHLVPTFPDLEQGIARTKAEVDLLRKLEYPLHEIFKKYIK